MKVLQVHLTAASPHDRSSGLLAFLTVEVAGGIALDGITLRKTVAGRMTLAFPVRTDQSGRRHPTIRPLNNEARQTFEKEVFAWIKNNS